MGSLASVEERWRKFYPTPEVASDDAIDLLSQLLKFNPSKRITPRDGMVHPYCAQFHDAETEIEWVGEKIKPPTNDNQKLQTQMYRSVRACAREFAVPLSNESAASPRR